MLDAVNYLVGPYYINPNLKPALSAPVLITIIFQIFMVKLS